VNATKLVAEMTRGEKVCAFIEGFCIVPEGDLVGRLMKLEPFQRDWLLDVYDNPHGTRLAILSVGKKNGKTPLIAALVLCHVAGPEARTNSQIVSGAMSQTQAATVFKYAWKMVQASPKLQALVRVQPSLKTLQGLAANVEYRAISRQKKTAHGIAPVLAILDELGQVKGPQDDFVEAIETALGAYDNSMLIVISTQAASDADLLSTWIDDQIRDPRPTTVCHVHSAKVADCDVQDETAWREANPALGIFRSEKDMRTLAEKASRMPAFEGSFRNLNLNQRVAQERLAFAPSVWRSGAGAIDMRIFRDGRPVHLGLDLSMRTDLTAAVAAALDDDENVHLLPFCYTPLTGLEERARRDRAPYDVWVKQGQLRAVPGSTVDYDWVCEDLTLQLGFMNIATVQFDRWRIDVLKAAAERTRFARLVGAWQEVGQGFKDISPRLEAFEAALLGGRVRHGGHPLLTMGAANAIAVSDPAGSRKLDKSKSTQRIDPLVAAVMAAFPALPEGRLTQEIDVLAMVG
jgi:phage terminase large subunit-like protein